MYLLSVSRKMGRYEKLALIIFNLCLFPQLNRFNMNP